jgi:hypothetical protein
MHKRLREHDCAKGFIIDGLEGKYSTHESYVNSLLKAIENSKATKPYELLFCHLNSSLATARIRQAALYGINIIKIATNLSNVSSSC